MKNIEKYKKEVIARLDTCQMERMIKDITGFNYCGSGSDHCTPCAEYVYKWLLSEYSESILDEPEREYLSAVIKPFRKTVMYVVKESIPCLDRDYRICIQLSYDNICLPIFNTGMYEGMKVNRKYSLKELGL